MRPLPPIPEGALAKSIFTGATKYEILHYLADARQRIEGQGGEFDSCPEEGEGAVEGLGSRGAKLRVSARGGGGGRSKRGGGKRRVKDQEQRQAQEKLEYDQD